MLQRMCRQLTVLGVLSVLIAGCGGPVVAPDLFTGPEAPLGARRSPQYGRLPLSLVVTMDKESYRVGDEIRLTVELTNPTEEPITFFDDGTWR